MTMRPLPITIGVVSTVLLGVTVWGAIGLTNHIIVAVDKWGNSAPDLKPTLATLNRPCGIRNVKSSANYSTFYSEGSLMPCGTLAEVATSVVKAGDAVVQTQLVERATTPHVTAAMDQFGAAAVHLSGTADALSKTASAGAQTLNALTVDEIALKQPIESANYVILKAGNSVDDFDALLKRKAIGDVLDNLAGATGQGNAILGDFRQVADKARADYLKPVPWYMQPIHRAGDIMDISAAIARHTP